VRLPKQAHCYFSVSFLFLWRAVVCAFYFENTVFYFSARLSNFIFENKVVE